MSRQNTLEKLTIISTINGKRVVKNYPNIYINTSANGVTEYFATWTQKGRRYIEKNLTSLYGVTTPTTASKKLNELRVYINNGKDPFKKEIIENIKTMSELVIPEIESRKASDNYKYIQKKVYEKHLQNSIGHLKIDSLNIDILLKVFRKLQEKKKKGGAEVSEATMTNIKKTIRPTLDYAVDKEYLSSNPLNSKSVTKLTKDSKKGGKAPLKHRILGRNKNKYLNIAKEIYQSSLVFNTPTATQEVNNEYQMAFILMLMTARRRSEILKIRYEDITDYDTVKTRAETTKTDDWEEYPLPKEVLERLKDKKSGPVFEYLTVNTYSNRIRKLISDLNLPIHGNMKIYGHDSRNLFLTIMSKETRNPYLCDSAISHNESKYKMLALYYQPDINDYIELFSQYWELLRKS